MTAPQSNEPRPLAALLAPDILVMLEESPQDVAAETEEMHAADLADVVEALPRERVAAFLNAISSERAADVLEYLDEELRAEVLERMSAVDAAEIVTQMTPDDRADLLEELEEGRADEILSEIPLEARRETERLLAYEPDSAGGIMTTEFVSIPQEVTVERALDLVRTAARSGRKEALYTVYATDMEGRLRGVMSLRELLAAPEGALVSELAWAEIMSVAPTADREEVARVTSDYDLVAVPVVDADGRLLGVVTVDDVIDAIVEEQTEEVQRLGGVQPLEDPYFQVGFWQIARKRAGWLVLLFVAEMFTATALEKHEAFLASAVALTFFIPLITSSGGNSGSQSATLIIRALAVGDVELRDAVRILTRELGQGLLLGTLLGGLGVARALMGGQSPELAAVVGLTLLSVVLFGSVVGAMLPLGLTKIGIDPAIASSPFIASFVDIGGIVIYVMIAIRILGG
jgi:magnesium transporter